MSGHTNEMLRLLGQAPIISFASLKAQQELRDAQYGSETPSLKAAKKMKQEQDKKLVHEESERGAAALAPWLPGSSEAVHREMSSHKSNSNDDNISHSSRREAGSKRNKLPAISLRGKAQSEMRELSQKPNRSSNEGEQHVVKWQSGATQGEQHSVLSEIISPRDERSPFKQRSALKTKAQLHSEAHSEFPTDVDLSSTAPKRGERPPSGMRPRHISGGRRLLLSNSPAAAHE